MHAKIRDLTIDISDIIHKMTGGTSSREASFEKEERGAKEDEKVSFGLEAR